MDTGSDGTVQEVLLMRVRRWVVLSGGAHPAAELCRDERKPGHAAAGDTAAADRQQAAARPGYYPAAARP